MELPRLISLFELWKGYGQLVLPHALPRARCARTALQSPRRTRWGFALTLGTSPGQAQARCCLHKRISVLWHTHADSVH